MSSKPTINCAVTQTLQLIGENWTILIIREAFFGTKRFDEFQQRLGIARNILSNRLNKLIDNEILLKKPIQPNARRMEYKLTEKGKDLFAIITSITQWGDRWLTPGDLQPVKIVCRDSGEEISQIHVTSNQGEIVTAHDVMVIAGPGASEEAKQRLLELQKTIEKKNTQR